MSRLGVYTYLKRYIGFVRDPTLCVDQNDGTLKMGQPQSTSLYFLFCVMYYYNTDKHIYAWRPRPKATFMMIYDWKFNAVMMHGDNYYYNESAKSLYVSQGPYQLSIHKDGTTTLAYSGFRIEKNYGWLNLSMHECAAQMYKDVKMITDALNKW